MTQLGAMTVRQVIEGRWDVYLPATRRLAGLRREDSDGDGSALLGRLDVGARDYAFTVAAGVQIPKRLGDGVTFLRQPAGRLSWFGRGDLEANYFEIPVNQVLARLVFDSPSDGVFDSTGYMVHATATKDLLRMAGDFHIHSHNMPPDICKVLSRGVGHVHGMPP